MTVVLALLVLTMLAACSGLGVLLRRRTRALDAAEGRAAALETALRRLEVSAADPLAGVRAALAIQEGLPGRRRLRLAGIQVRIGLHTGRVLSHEGDYFGRNVALTAVSPTETTAGRPSWRRTGPRRRAAWLRPDRSGRSP